MIISSVLKTAKHREGVSEGFQHWESVCESLQDPGTFHQTGGERDGSGVTTVVDITSLLAPQSRSQDNNHTDQALHARQHTGGGGGGSSYLNLGS